MEVKELQEHIDRRLDALETKLDRIAPKVVAHAEQIKSLQGYAKYGMTVFLAVVGYLAVAFFTKGPAQ